MKKALAGVALVLGGLLVVAGTVPAAQAYPEVSFEAHVDDQVVFEFESFVASSEANVDCDWTHEWNGKTQRGQGKSHRSKFKAPAVDAETVIPVHFTCAYDGSVTAGRAVLIPAETWNRTVNVTVLPRGAVRDSADTNATQSALPNTGGPSMYVLVGGLLLLVVGVLAAWAARRRAEGLDVQA